MKCPFSPSPCKNPLLFWWLNFLSLESITPIRFLIDKCKKLNQIISIYVTTIWIPGVSVCLFLWKLLYCLSPRKLVRSNYKFASNHRGILTLIHICNKMFKLQSVLLFKKSYYLSHIYNSFALSQSYQLFNNKPKR